MIATACPGCGSGTDLPNFFFSISGTAELASQRGKGEPREREMRQATGSSTTSQVDDSLPPSTAVPELGGGGERSAREFDPFVHARRGEHTEIWPDGPSSSERTSRPPGSSPRPPTKPNQA